ncbi:hypothetical protein GCM10020255_043180 [Rhodococcus baikonurensis]
MELIDLTRTLDPADRELLPEGLKALASVVAPSVAYSHPQVPDATSSRQHCSAEFMIFRTVRVGIGDVE